MKTPPSAIESEESLLAILIIEGEQPGIAEKVFSSVDEDQLYSPKNRDVFACLKRLHDSGAVLSPDAIVPEIGAETARYLKEDVPAFGNINLHADKIKEAARKRRLAEITDKAHQAAMDGGQSYDISAALLHEIELVQKDAGDFEPVFITSATPRPPEPEYLFNVNEIGMIPMGTVGAIAATGGTGKSFLVSHLGAALASGRRFGPIEPSGKKRVMILNAEDDDATIAIRLLDITDGKIPDDLLACSLSGRVEPLLEVDNGAIRRGKWFSWLDRLLSKHEVDVLILDPFSRFYGAEENNSTHGTAWINALEYLRVKHSITIIVCHHTNEASQQSTGRMNKTMLRGTSALSDGYRWAFGMRKMTEDDAKNFGLEADRKAYVELDDIKRNSGKAMPKPLYFRQNDQTGAFEHVGPSFNRLKDIGEALVDAIDKTGAELTRRELREKKPGKEIADMVSDAVKCKFVRSKDMDKAIDYCLEKGWLVEADINTGKNTKTVIMGINGAKNEQRQTVPKNDLAALCVCNDSELTAPKDNTAKNKFGTEKHNNSNNLTPPKNHPLKGEDGVLAPFPSLGVLPGDHDVVDDIPEGCLDCQEHQNRGVHHYCLEHVDHDSRMKKDTPCDQARTQCRGPY